MLKHLTKKYTSAVPVLNVGVKNRLIAACSILHNRISERLKPFVAAHHAHPRKSKDI